MNDMSNPSPAGGFGRLLKIEEVQLRTGLHRVTIYRRIAKGLFPKPFHPGARASRWSEVELDTWLRAQRE
jgi:prophage regulatory protein